MKIAAVEEKDAEVVEVKPPGLLALAPEADKELSHTVRQRVSYTCADCQASVYLKADDHVRCRECGCRLLFKKRTRRAVQHEAR